MTDKNLGHATAYGYAKSEGYTGTEKEFAELMASYAEVASDARGYADDAEQSATDAKGYADDAEQSVTDAQQYAQQAKESAESIDMSSFATKAELSEFESEVSQTYATSASLSAVNDELNDTKVALNDAIEDFAVPTQEAVDNWLNEHPEATTTVQDGSVTTAKLASDVLGMISHSGINEDVKQTLLNIFEHVAFIDDQGETYVSALEDALYPPANLLRIGAVFDQGDNLIYDTDSLDTLKQYLIVTAYYDDGTNSVINSYALTGTLEEGISTITVSYGGKATTFNVTVTTLLPSGYTKISAIAATINGNNSCEFVTDYSINSNSVFELEGKITTNVAMSSFFTDHSASGYGFGYNSAKRWISYRGGTEYNNISYVADSNVHTFTVYANNTIKIDDDMLMGNVLDGGKTSGKKMYIFGDYHTDSALYYLKIYENDALVAYFTPCIRNTDSRVGMYEVIGKKFFGNANLTAIQ